MNPAPPVYDTFTVYKFRSMVPDAEAETGVKLSEEDAGGVDPRVTRVRKVLRRTHLDELPQLWSILMGDMSVVGPRPERPEPDADIERDVEDWPSRWFVKPGLTGLAQINDATGHEPDRKLRYDLEYIRKQSF
jgi:lipopolysaccharide/colanic/teichoic acid biosynthesis glycosyltransferase